MNDIIKCKADLREAINNELQQRTIDHERQVSRVRRGQARRKAKGLVAKQTQLDFLAIGDSWFDYPLSDAGLPYPNQAIVAPTQLQAMGKTPPKILSYAVAGQAMTTILSWENQDRIITVLEDSSQWLNGKTADAILVSGGGDDIVGDSFAIYVDYEGNGLDQARFQGILDSVKASYLDLFALRDAVAPGVPIIGHCYDYAIPNGIHPGFFGGPWLKPSLDFAGYDYSEGLVIVKNAIDAFRLVLEALASDTKNEFILVNTNQTLTRDNSHPLGWANELHPYTAGFTALAQKFLLALQAKFPGRI